LKSEDSTSQCEQTPRRVSSIFKFTNSPEHDAHELSAATGLGYMELRVRKMILSTTFEVIFSALILLNTITMTIECQYISFDTAHELGYQNASSSADTWPQADICFFIIQMLFGCLFTMEIVLKCVVGPRLFVRSAWNWFDTLIVAFWIASSALSGIFFNPMLMRLARLARLLRLVKLVRTIQLFDVLHLLVGSLVASAKVLLWSLVLLCGIMVACALTLNFLLDPFILDGDKPYESRILVYEYFGSFSRSSVTMFEMTLGNWVPPVRLLQDRVNEAYGPLLLLYVGLVHFAVVQVIRGVFVHETFQVANLDDDMMVLQRERMVKKHAEKMSVFFSLADTSGDGFLSFEEFDAILEDKKIQMWLSAMGLDVQNARLAFELLDDGDNKLSADDLIQGVSLLKGNARSIDLMATHVLIRRLEKLMLQQVGASPSPSRQVTPQQTFERQVSPPNPLRKLYTKQPSKSTTFYSVEERRKKFGSNGSNF